MSANGLPHDDAAYIASLEQQVNKLQQKLLVLEPLKLEVLELRQKISTFETLKAEVVQLRQHVAALQGPVIVSPPSLPADFIVQEYQPDHPVKRDNASPVRPLDWTTANDFFQNIPKTEDDWVRRRKSLGIATVEGILEAVDILCLNGGRNPIHHGPPDSDKDAFISFLGKFGELTIESLCQAERELKFSRYRLQVFFALCNIALDGGGREAEVYETLGRVLDKWQQGPTKQDHENAWIGICKHLGGLYLALTTCTATLRPAIPAPLPLNLSTELTYRFPPPVR
ncbi:hypothetical protein JX266_012685 [Neoarthrinium moseri]|nr:hypothetical protein JX266_012685 [Neoarthrinium moseri]